MAITTAQQLLEAGDIGRCELTRGRLVMMMPPGGRHGKLANLIAHRLTAYVATTGEGTVLAETGFLLSRDPDTVRAPDVAFLRAGREVGDGFVEGAPDLAVEVLSPGDRAGYVRERVAEWLEAGAQLVWVVDPAARTVAVHSCTGTEAVLGETDALGGGGMLSGFAFELRELFD